MPPVLLMSGGLDSFAAWRLLGQPKPIYFGLGHRYQKAELAALDSLEQACNRMGIIFEPLRQDRLYLGDVERASAYIPFRNMLLLTVAALEGETIYIGALRGETSKDKSNHFFKQMTSMLSYMDNREIRAVAPFRHLTKTQLIKRYILRFPTSDDVRLLTLTRSCYSSEIFQPGIQGCGECVACFRRWVAMSLNGVHENYSVPPNQFREASVSNWPEWLKIIRRLPVSEWVGVIANNLDAVRALQKPT